MRAFLEGADVTETRCFFPDCEEPGTKTLAVSLRGVSRTLDLCAEHFHDIDWGVISEEELASRIEEDFGSQGVA
ncbi:MAG: hypothetical protein JWR01_2645 [Subtercola sp.]|nr:hypothetical protein [Subtercola sp.]